MKTKGRRQSDNVEDKRGETRVANMYKGHDRLQTTPVMSSGAWISNGLSRKNQERATAGESKYISRILNAQRKNNKVKNSKETFKKKPVQNSYNFMPVKKAKKNDKAK